ncbi:MAG: hypothetical protein WKF88_01850 [Ferruginibacter sp.]
MKNILIILATFILFTGCKKDTSASNQTETQQQQSLSDGSWRVTYFSVNNVDKTADFSGFRMTFETNGRVSLINDLFVKGGTYTISKRDGKNSVNFIFPFDNSFMMMTDLSGGFWDITFQNSGEVKMQRRISDNNGVLDYLTLVKI